MATQIVACGGWSKRKTLYGGDQYAGREDSLLDPSRDAAKIRAFFVHPDWARRGIGSLILEACENAAVEAGFTRLEMGATLSGVAFYRAKGYARLRTRSPLGNGEALPIVKMAKEIRKCCRFEIFRLLISNSSFSAPAVAQSSQILLPARC